MILVVELAVFVAMLGPQARGALLSTVRGLGRLLIAVLAAAITIGLEGAVTLSLLAGIDPVVSFLALVPSYASALLLVVPLALVPLPVSGSRVQAFRRLEGVIQLAVTIALAITVFSPIFVVSELILVAVIVPALTVASGGPFGVSQGVVNAGVIVQLFMLSAAITALFLATVRSEREALRAEKEHPLSCAAASSARRSDSSSCARRPTRESRSWRGTRRRLRTRFLSRLPLAEATAELTS
ncbi:hypothetical protein GCM10009792_26040 [Microcella alkalica]|uniref:Uncharacterized protein n=1 Tax=Microcella alkalica TaxID=355930 RepID=A0A839E732_9MICO|nr:hypothetical protein [Microcella alkalica]MBA8848469.1 hypothetical protein [Microcella alkalica]